ncbi:MAG: class I SAM-dependent methyltransferase [Pseudomonadota bacterium]
MTNLAHAPSTDAFEACACYLCGAAAADPLVTGEDDLTGKPGRFSFVRCRQCALAYQSPRLTLDWVKLYYDDEYIAHRKKTDWGWLTPFYEKSMRKHDLSKLALVDRALKLAPGQRVLDIGCAAGTFLLELIARDKVAATGVDFKDLSHLPTLKDVDFRCGLLAEQSLAPRSFSLITMWHFLEHDYDPNATLARCRDLLADDGRLVIEVPRFDSLSYKLYGARWPGLQAPQHTALYSKATLIAMVKKQGLEVVEYLPWGAFPSYFYLFAGAAFKLLRGCGLNLDRAILPYFLGQILLSPVLLFERRLNLAMQTVICRRAQ